MTLAKELAPVKTGGQLSYIDKSAATKIKVNFDEAEAFQEGLALVKKAAGKLKTQLRQ
ncbi:MAG TPA: WG repeat-containing protein [Oculatellaceae cyanobacterium]